jgi:hypothetical protein
MQTRGDPSTKMPVLSERARAILDQMEPNGAYDASELRTFAPDMNLETLHEVMHELWLAREVDRFTDHGWRRVRSTRRDILRSANADRCASTTADAADAASLRIGTVRPEDLFDHESFAGWFK